ncbi:MAG: NTP transferase domain-containing protein, partial [Nitrospirae bacterium]|nr:NTP transferase domain-containing protein [Nitrospirota bacterium]
MNHVIILAAGQGQRMGIKKDKILLPVNGKPILYYSIMAFNDHPEIDTITIVANKINKSEIEKTIKTYKFSKIKKVIIGGLTRQKSVEKGLKELEKSAKPSDIIIVHNGANPLPSHEEISKSIEEASEHGACIVGHYITSTVKEVDDQHIIKTHDKNNLFAAETPQTAIYKIMKKALDHTVKNKLEVTDEAMMFEAIGQKTKYIKADENNFKITSQADYLKLKTILGEMPEDFRTGIGQDSHMFEEKKKGLVLAGIKLPDELKLEANSDGDVILHAIFNALSQSIGEMSLGFYADDVCAKGVKDSKKYLEIILKKVKKQGFKVNSLGLMIEAAKPKIDPLVSKMKKSLAEILDLNTR